MKTSDVIILLKNLVTNLQSERATAFSSGNLERVTEIDVKIVETQTTIDQFEAIQTG